MSAFSYEVSKMGPEQFVNGSDKSVSYGYATDSPLKLFVVAKRQINETFSAIQRYVEDSEQFLSTCEQDIVSESKVKNVHDLSEMVGGIREVLARDNMKVAFFGRTSNGKSTVINAVLNNKILPSGMGHTTNCFLQVEGTDSSEAFLVVDAFPNEKKNVESVAHLANALNTERLDDASLVQIFWPKSKCTLLRDEVVLVDSPGIDVTPNLDEWIDKHCTDADVFVLVSNAESTLMRTEMAFFLKVSQKLSKPNIFILNNRWDAVAAEPENLDLVRKQHQDRSIAFLCDELKVANKDEAMDRIFFVSAKEALQTRLALNADQPLPTFTEGYQHRYREFEQFEMKFEECLSQAAVKTKFNQHTDRGLTIIKDLERILTETHDLAEKFQNEKSDKRRELYERLLFTQKQMQLIKEEINEQIYALVDLVDLKVRAALNEEIKRLSLLVNDYHKPFNAEPMILTVYKKELHSHVERGLGSNLRARLSTALTNCVDTSQKGMTGRIADVVPNVSQHPSLSFNMKPRNFEILYRLNCESLCADFQEDLEFRFSLGLLSIIKRFRNSMSSKKSVPKSIGSNMSPIPPDSKAITTSALASEGLILMFLERVATSTPQSQTTIGALALGGFMVKTIGWRVIGLTCGIYALLYVYERVTWTNKAKERAFKKQYVNHATKKLQLIVQFTSANCSQQVQQELTSSFVRLCGIVDESVKEMNAEVTTLDKELEHLSSTSSEALGLKNKARGLIDELTRFCERYLNRQ
ncbi:Transmembrane GTPase Marf [Halotydeus destructor]|nr:Transmembrane GTPase Marf [Halotydeus destructor]